MTNMPVFRGGISVNRIDIYLHRGGLQVHINRDKGVNGSDLRVNRSDERVDTEACVRIRIYDEYACV